MRSSSKKRENFQRRIDGLILVAKGIRDAGEFVPFPFVKAAGATVVTLLESIRGMKVNEDGCALLAQDAIKLLEQINSTAKEAPSETSRLQKPVEDFITILNNTLESVLVIAERSPIKRYLHQASDAEAIRDHRQEINSAFTLFMTVTVMQIHQEQERAREAQERAENQRRRIEEEHQRAQEERRRIKEEQQRMKDEQEKERRRVQEEQEKERRRIEAEQQRMKEEQEKEWRRVKEEEEKARWRIQEEHEKERKRAAESRLLSSLPVVMAKWNEEKTCLEGTRVALLDEIRSWATNQDSSVKRIYWLADVAGSGKSTIANHMSNEWRSTGHLGGCFAFSRDVAERTITKHFFPTLCNDLAKWHPELRSLICKSIDADPSITSGPLRDQFDALIAQPISQAPKSLIFVIDALDECVNERPALLNVFITKLSQTSLPIKFFITSRPEWDISSVLRESSQNRGGFDLHGTQNVSDVRLYVKSQLLSPSFTGRSTLWPGPTAEEAAALAERAGGLFIWASTACKMLNDSIDSQDLFSRLLTDPSLANLDKLYLEALKLATLPNDPLERAQVARILHAIVMVLEPLSIDAIDELLGVHITEQVVRRLASVLSVSSDRTQPVRTLHPTFREVLTDPERCTDPTFLVDIKGTHGRLSNACFSSMQVLRKDICNINDPSLLNSEIPSLEAKLARALTHNQRYACRFWAFHAAEVIKDHNTQDLTLTFFNTHFLHWLEALSLMGKTNEAFWALRHLETRLKTEHEYQRDIRIWSSDALKFVQLHQPLIQMSAAHIHISALTFTPQSATISQHYKPREGTCPIIQRNQEMLWPSGLTLIGHTSRVNSVSFSPDGTRIASASDDKTIRLWDAISGLPVGTPLEGHTRGITAIVFSPDGTLIASASEDRSIRLWDAVSGSPIGTPFNGHTASARCIAFSPDGTRVVSGSSDNTVRLWNTVSGLPIGTPLNGHHNSVWCIAFSPDGTRIASGSNDHTIRLWDAVSGSSVGTPLLGHTHNVLSITFSPDGSRIASGSRDNTIRLWDAISGSPIGTPLDGHSDWIRSIKFSPDGTRIASGSDDRTIRLWDAVSGSPVGTPLDGNTDFVYSIAFSQDGTRIVSGSEDNTVRVFEVAFGSHVDTGTPDRHVGSINCVSFSSDGTHFASGSSDKTIRFWDALSGLPVSTPLIRHPAAVTCVTYSSDGTRLASGSLDNSVRIWDPVTGMPLGQPLQSEYEGGVLSLTFSRDNRAITASYPTSGLPLKYRWKLNNAQLPLSITASRAHDQATSSEPEKKAALQEEESDEEVEVDEGSVESKSGEAQSDAEIELGQDGWVYQTGSNWRRLFYIPHPVRRCSAVRGARLVAASDQGQIAIIDCSNLLQ